LEHSKKKMLIPVLDEISSRALSMTARQVEFSLASFLALFFELVIIRYLSSEPLTFAYLKKVCLIAVFFGLGIGVVLAGNERREAVVFAFTGLFPFLIIRFAPVMGFWHLPMPYADCMAFGEDGGVERDV
jgi:hypothetical protein